jgi:hypothetical protein
MCLFFPFSGKVSRRSEKVLEEVSRFGEKRGYANLLFPFGFCVVMVL